MKHIRPTHGFSLIELLVVMAVIALLIGLLLPALARARDASRQSACLFNVKQVTAALPVHALDFKGYHPLAGAAIGWGEVELNPAFPQLPSWMEQLHPYLETQDVYRCATFPGEDENYHYFLGTRAAYIDAGGRAPIREDRAKHPSAHVILGDTNYNFQRTVTNLPDADKDDYTLAGVGWDYLNSGQHWRPHHNGALNLAFLDGHAAAFARFEPAQMTFRYDSMAAW